VLENEKAQPTQPVVQPGQEPKETVNPKKQIETLEKMGINANEIDNSGKAKLLIKRIIKRREAGLATPKQIRLLESRGFRKVGSWKFEEANNMITRIAANGWRLPKGIIAKEYTPGQ